MKAFTNLRPLAIASMISASILLISCGEKKEEDAAANSEAPEASTETPAAIAVTQDSVESLTDELIVQLNVYADTILAVKDKASAEEAVAKLDGIGDAITNIASRMDKLDTPDEATNIAVDQKMQQASMEMKTKMQSVQTIMSDPEVAGVLVPALQNFGKRMAKQEQIFMRFGKKKEPTNEATQEVPAEDAGPAPTPADEPATDSAAP
jgi:flagellar basal body-associated protein FliL